MTTTGKTIRSDSPHSEMHVDRGAIKNEKVILHVVLVVPKVSESTDKASNPSGNLSSDPREIPT